MILQNFVWDKYKITVPNFELLLPAYFKRFNLLPPDDIGEVESFLKDFGSFLQPVSGFICTHRYKREELEKVGIFLEKITGIDGLYKDSKYGMYWMEFVSYRDYGYSDGPPYELILIGKDNIPGLTWS